MKSKLLDIAKKGCRYIYLHAWQYRRAEHVQQQRVDMVRQRGEARVVFIAMSVSLWKYQHLVETLRADRRFKVTVVLSPALDFDSQQQTRDVEALRSYFQQKQVPYIDFDLTGKTRPFDIKAKLDKIKVKDAGDDFKTFEAEDGGGSEGEGGDAPEDDEEALLQKCLDVIVSSDRASTSMLQRKLRLGYNKAARIMDELEQRGCIGPANGSAPRDILRSTLHDPSEAPDADDDAPPPDDDSGD